MAKQNPAEETVSGKPVDSFPLEFQWYKVWEPVFDRQVETIRADINRARSNERLVAYLSCPISSRGGGFSPTNVEISEFAELRLRHSFGMGVWFLNPTNYQLESKVGRELMKGHAQQCLVEIDDLPDPRGGDYMRMWTKVLVEDGNENRGDLFDMYYFLGPTDALQFVKRGGATTATAAVEDYFARKINADYEFHLHFSPPFFDSDGNEIPEDEQKSVWKRLRRDFIRFYALRDGAAYSKGCHDEWNIWVILNSLRVNERGVGSQIVGYFDGQQIDPHSSEGRITRGYALNDHE